MFEQLISRIHVVVVGEYSEVASAVAFDCDDALEALGCVPVLLSSRVEPPRFPRRLR